MPASTKQHDLTLTLHNDTRSLVTVQLIRENGGQPGITICMRGGEDLTLVVISGTSYKYAIERHVSASIRRVEMLVNMWYDGECKISNIFSAPYSPHRCGCNQDIQVAEGIKVAFREWGQESLPAHNGGDPCRDVRRSIQRGNG